MIKISVPAMKSAAIKVAQVKPVNLKPPKVTVGAKPVIATAKTKAISLKVPAMRQAMANTKTPKLSMPSGVKAP